MSAGLLRLVVITVSCASVTTPVFSASTPAEKLPVASAHTASIKLHQGGDFSVTLTPDGSRLAFDLVGGIWAMNPADGNAEALTEITESNGNPAFSPDGQWIAYASVRDGFHQIMLINKDGGTPTPGHFRQLSPSRACLVTGRPDACLRFGPCRQF